MKYSPLNLVIILTFLLLWVTPDVVFSTGFRFKEKCSVVEIPFSLINGMIIIPVSINGSKELNFVLDTGARSMILFSKKYARQLELDYDKKISFLGVGNKTLVDAFVSHGQDVSLPGLEANNISIVILNNQLNALTAKDIHGAIGYQIFAQFIVKIDYENMVLTLYNDSSFEPEGDFDYLPLMIEDAKPHIESRICTNNKRLSVRLMIDTGFNDDLMVFKNEKNVSWISQSTSGNNKTIGYGLGGSIKGHQLYNVDIHMNNTMISGINILTPEVIPSENIFTPLDGLIGNMLLYKYSVVIIDYMNERLYFKNIKTPDHYLAKNHDIPANK